MNEHEYLIAELRRKLIPYVEVYADSRLYITQKGDGPGLDDDDFEQAEVKEEAALNAMAEEVVAFFSKRNEGTVIIPQVNALGEIKGVLNTPLTVDQQPDKGCSISIPIMSGYGTFTLTGGDKLTDDLLIYSSTALEESGEDDPCPYTRDCKGKLIIRPTENCSCHIYPPCNACVDSVLICSECGEY